VEQKRLQRKQAMHCAADHAEVMQPPQLARPRDVVDSSSSPKTLYLI
jgi:hypothetical protein